MPPPYLFPSTRGEASKLAKQQSPIIASSGVKEPHWTGKTDEFTSSSGCQAALMAALEYAARGISALHRLRRTIMFKVAPNIIPVMMAMIECPQVIVTFSVTATTSSSPPLPKLVSRSLIIAIRTRKKLRETSHWKMEDASIGGTLYVYGSWSQYVERCWLSGLDT